MNMYDRTPRWLVIGLLAVSPYALAQQSPPPPGAAPAAPTRAVPRPDDLEPGVNTSAPTATTPSATTPDAGAASGRSASPGASVSGPTDTTPATAPKVGKSPAGAKAATSGKSAANSSGPPDTPTASSNSGAKGAKGGKAEDRLQLDTTQITGNQELPKVLYIVPWKRSDLGDLLGKPANSLLDEVLEPVDRDVFKRENRYYDALQEDAAGGADKAAGAASQGSGDKH
jgi:hypothetical protein